MRQARQNLVARKLESLQNRTTHEIAATQLKINDFIEVHAGELIPADGTVKATSLTPSVATVTCTGGNLVITPVAKGSCIVELEASKEEYAPWTTTILVIVK